MFVAAIPMCHLVQRAQDTAQHEGVADLYHRMDNVYALLHLGLYLLAGSKDGGHEILLACVQQHVAQLTCLHLGKMSSNLADPSNP